MSAPDRLENGALDGLLDGSPSSEAAGTPLAAYLHAIRDEAAATPPVPSDELRTVLAEGLDPSELGAGEATAHSGGVLLGWRGRGRLAARALVTKFAALGLVTKMAATGAAVTVAASGAGAAGVLPPPAQSTFDDVVGREAPVEDIQEGADEEDAEHGTEVDETSPTTPADTSTTPPLETDVPDDATGTSDSEPGVDGGEVADDASGDRRVPGEDAPEEPPAEERTGDTPADDVVDETPATAPTGQEAPPREDGPTGQEQSTEQDATERATIEQPDARPSEQAELDRQTPGS